MDGLTFIAYGTLGLILIMIIAIVIKTTGALKQNTFILKEIKRKKEKFEDSNEIKFISKGRGFYVFAYGLIILLVFNPIFIFDLYTFDKILESIGLVLLTLMVDALLITFIYATINKGVKKILIKDGLLTIYYDKKEKEYDIHNIEIIKTRISHGRRNAFLYLYIKNRDDDKYDGYLLSYYSETNIIALVILIELLKRGNIDETDSLTEEEIEEYINMIKIKNANERLKDNEIRHIVL